MRRVVILYKYVPQYRAAFFQALRDQLAASDVELTLVYGQPSPEDATKRDAVELPWAQRICNRTYDVGKRRVYWQPVPWSILRKADLVIVEQASKLLMNYVLLAAQFAGGPRVALWGHGRNHQLHNASRFGEMVKARVSRLPHWWFAYTSDTAALVAATGYPADRITVVDNAIETEALVQLAETITNREILEFREAHGIRSRNVALFVGGMYPEKRLRFLIGAARNIRLAVPDFELILVGAGPSQEVAREAASSLPWVHYTGPLFGREKATAFATAKTLLMPGLVGLAVLDSFAFSRPIVTTNIDYHSPEISYVVDRENGLITEDDIASYAAVVGQLFRDPALESRLRDGCHRSAKRYTLHNMVDRFSYGVQMALARPG